jgi:uncharacterized Zn finger protein
LSDWLIAALEKAGRKDEITPLCEHEAEITGSYVRLADYLIAERQWEEAERWCKRGIEAAETDRPGTDNQLRDRLRTISEQTGDRLRAVAFRADDFFAYPSLESFQELIKTARRARVGPAVDVWARHYLQTGQLPRPATKKGSNRKGDPDREWPLPETGLKPKTQRRVPKAPMTSVLIQIAIAEKKPDEVLKWYDQETSGGFYDSESLQVAEAVGKAYPERAIEIWKATAESLIARTQVDAYQEAGIHLRKVKETLTHAKRQSEWQAYLDNLREQNKRKPRCIEVLDGLAGKRIIDG